MQLFIKSTAHQGWELVGCYHFDLDLLVELYQLAHHLAAKESVVVVVPKVEQLDRLTD